MKRTTAEQILQDMLAAGIAPQTTLKSAMEKLVQDRTLAQQVQDKFDHHQYPEQSLKWMKARYNPAYYDLTPEELKVAYFLAQESAQSGGVQIAATVACGVLHMSKKTYQRALEGLEEKDVVRVHRTTKKRGQPPILAIDPSFMQKGKARSIYDALDPTSTTDDTPSAPKVQAEKVTVKDARDGNYPFYPFTYNRLTKVDVGDQMAKAFKDAVEAEHHDDD